MRRDASQDLATYFDYFNNPVRGAPGKEGGRPHDLSLKPGQRWRVLGVPHLRFLITDPHALAESRLKQVAEKVASSHPN